MFQSESKSCWFLLREIVLASGASRGPNVEHDQVVNVGSRARMPRLLLWLKRLVPATTVAKMVKFSRDASNPSKSCKAR